MLDDLCSFEENLPQINLERSGPQDFPDFGLSVPDDQSQKFNTLRRAGQGQQALSYSNYEDYGDEEDLSLDTLSKDIDLHQDQKHKPFSEEELATLSPVIHELDHLVDDLTSMGQSGANKDVKLPTVAKPVQSNKDFSQPLKITVNNELKPHTEKREKPVPPPVSQKPKLQLSAQRPKSEADFKDDQQPASQNGFTVKHSDSFESIKLQLEHKDHSMLKKTDSINSRLTKSEESITKSERSTTSDDISRSSTISDDLSRQSLAPDDVNRPADNFTTDTADIAKFSQSLSHGTEPVDNNNLSQEEREERLKSEKMRIALEKLKEARIQKLVVKVYNKDDSSKTMVIDERMTVRTVIKQLIEKNHFEYSPNWTLIEELPSVFMERMFEEHEKPCELMSHWTRDTTNQVRFMERKDKYALFKNPQHYLLAQTDQQENMQERQKQTLIEEFFSGKGPSSSVPEVEGYLHIKGDGKSWSRKYCVLRSSGLYVSKSGEPKKGKKLADLTCLVMFEQIYLYLGRGWKKKFKSPYDYGFALKHPAIQVKSKHIKYLVCEDFKSFMRWTVGIRLAKYGSDLLQNYEKTNEETKSTSNLSSLSYGRKTQQPQSAGGTPARVADGEGRPNTLPRGLGVKNIFEGAWQRANQEEKSADSTSDSLSVNSSMTRNKSVWKPNTKKSTNWWDLQDEDSASGTNSLASSLDALGSNNSLDKPGPTPPPPPPSVLSKPSASLSSMEHSLPPPMVVDDNLPLPPPAPSFLVDNLDMPPPPGNFYNAGNSPGKSFPPPPPPMGKKPNVPSETSGTFMQYDDPLPLPPPVPNYSEKKSFPPVPQAQPGFGLPYKGGPPKPPPKVPPKNYSNNNNSPTLEDPHPPPTFQPPPPEKSASLGNRVQAKKAPKKVSGNANNNHISPLTHYYSGGNPSVDQKASTFAMDDLPPPPPFVYDLKKTFAAVSKNAGNVEMMAVENLPPPPNTLFSYIKSNNTQGDRDGSVNKRIPPPPRRSAQTRLSGKHR
ncbi:unnamed protein product [Clavelina lepadiformis]|uniref:Uncharacterized protein n=1 Tax=Clavelina lepadiformis TaxID=159417 RepID=A0ABP0GT89_CLALP